MITIDLYSLMALCTELSSHEIRAKTIQPRDILDALKENSESDSWIQELHRKRGKKDFENALDNNKSHYGSWK